MGGGIAGASAALHLALHGRRVTVLERGEIASGASGVNAGMIDSTGRGHAPDLQAHLTAGGPRPVQGVGDRSWRGHRAPAVGLAPGHPHRGAARLRPRPRGRAPRARACDRAARHPRGPRSLEPMSPRAPRRSLLAAPLPGRSRAGHACLRANRRADGRPHPHRSRSDRDRAAGGGRLGRPDHARGGRRRAPRHRRGRVVRSHRGDARPRHPDRPRARPDVGDRAAAAARLPDDLLGGVRARLARRSRRRTVARARRRTSRPTSRSATARA